MGRDDRFRDLAHRLAFLLALGSQFHIGIVFGETELLHQDPLGPLDDFACLQRILQFFRRFPELPHFFRILASKS